MIKMTFDIIVIGKGLIGSAAAKYLSRKSLNIAIIGPDEPDNYKNATIFSSHYDSGRVLRQLGKNSVMTVINQHAHQEYPRLEKESEIHFQSRNGCLYVNPYGKDRYLQNIDLRAKRHNVKIYSYKNGESIKKDFPYLHFPEASKGVYEPAPSGHINPRLLLEAQLKILAKNGGTVLREIVNEVIYDSEFTFVRTTAGNIYRSKKVIFATGAFTNLMGLIKRKIDLSIKSETIILAELYDEDLIRLKTMPSLLYEVNTPDIEGIYATQPIRYPDGNYYLKIGANLPQDQYFTNDLEEVKIWFGHGDSDSNIPVFEHYLHQIFPGLKIKRILSKKCILTRTNSKLENPFIATIEKGRSYAAVGNGWSGGNSDGIGYIAAILATTGRFPKGFEEKEFRRP